MSIEITDIARSDGSLTPERTASREELKRLAQQFEAMLMTQMLREMRKSMLDEEEQEEGFGADAMIDTGDIELGAALSRVGGVGITEALLRAFERQATGHVTPGEATPTIQPVRTPTTMAIEHTPEAGRAAAPISPSDITVAAPISSRFGWRQDPLTGVAKFHQGIDIAVAYGRDVKAAAEGRVAFAGVQSGYGHTVVIDHEGGRQTRYAHLSEPLVRAGEAVAEGQIVGKSGNSGRTTGPHLHFEMLIDGTPVDPTRLDAE